jgi:hypothetical protein
MAKWRVAGNVLIACNCDWGCPCNFNAPPSRGYCEGGWIWSIETGQVNEVPVDGLGMALVAKWPGAIHEGGGRAACFVDDRADATQRAALTAVLKGEYGGPWGILNNTYALAEPAFVPFDVRLAGHATRAVVGDAVELVLQKIRNPVTQAEVHPEIVLPEGLVVKAASLAASKVFRVYGEVQYDHGGQYAAFGRFDYS